MDKHTQIIGFYHDGVSVNIFIDLSVANQRNVRRRYLDLYDRVPVDRIRQPERQPSMLRKITRREPPVETLAQRPWLSMFLVLLYQVVASRCQVESHLGGKPQYHHPFFRLRLDNHLVICLAQPEGSQKVSRVEAKV